MKKGSLKVVSDPFFTSGYKYREIESKAPKLASALGQHDLLVFKGDANYRRLLGERKWAPGTVMALDKDDPEDETGETKLPYVVKIDPPGATLISVPRDESGTVRAEVRRHPP